MSRPVVLRKQLSDKNVLAKTLPYVRSASKAVKASLLFQKFMWNWNYRPAIVPVMGMFSPAELSDKDRRIQELETEEKRLNGQISYATLLKDSCAATV